MNRPNATKEIIGAFEAANLVGLGERHWVRQDSEFRIRLVREPAFARAASVIVVEFATARRQPLLDAFVEGADVSPSGLSEIWRDTTQPGAFDSPVYEDFLRAVREVNRGLRPARRLRILAGDPPIDWSGIFNGRQIRDCAEGRDRFAASVIERDVLNRDRQALVVYGALHLCRKGPATLVELVRGGPRARWFTIVPAEGAAVSRLIGAPGASAADPALVSLGDSPVGGLEANEIFGKDTRQVKLVDGKAVLGAQLFAPAVKLRDAADACLYFGDSAPEFVPRHGGIAGTDYGREVDRRRALLMGLRSD